MNQVREPNTGKLRAAELKWHDTVSEVVTDEDYLPRIPSLEIPQPTEPLHIGRTFRAPAPVRTPEQEHPWLWVEQREPLLRARAAGDSYSRARSI